MPKCKKCEKNIPSYPVIDGVERDFRKRKYCLECNPFKFKKENICLKCGKGFPNRIRIEDKIVEMHNRKYCLECNPFGARKIWGGKISKGNSENGKRILEKHNFTCSICGVERYQKTRNLICTTCSSKKIRNENKKKGIEYLGGKCKICGYDKCAEAFDMHHRDSREKEFALSYNWQRNWKKIKKELDKCDLLCANCHRELHFNMKKSILGL